MYKKIFCFILFFLIYFVSQLSAETTCKVMVEIDGLRNNKGLVLCSLFTNKDGFPSKYKKAYRFNTAEIDDNKTIFIFDNVPYGFYAIAVLHDENRNYKIDTNILGIPKEGIGVSNNVVSKFGPPSFKNAVFEANQETLIIQIKMKYIGG